MSIIQSPRQKEGALKYRALITNLQWNLTTVSTCPTGNEVAHNPPPSHYDMYVDPLVPTYPPILVKHTINSVINWVITIHNHLYDIQSLRAHNTPH